MTLSEAIAEVRRIDAAKGSLGISMSCEAERVVFNAIVSGELVTKDHAGRLLDDAYLAGFSASGEGYNGEYGWNAENADWMEKRARDLSALSWNKP